MYLLCAGGGFILYVIFGFCHIPGPNIASYHKITGSLIMFACYYSYYKACSVDPGYIVSSTKKKAIKRFKYDYLMFTPK